MLPPANTPKLPLYLSSSSAIPSFSPPFPFFHFFFFPSKEKPVSIYHFPYSQLPSPDSMTKYRGADRIIQALDPGQTSRALFSVPLQSAQRDIREVFFRFREVRGVYGRASEREHHLTTARIRGRGAIASPAPSLLLGQGGSRRK